MTPAPFRRALAVLSLVLVLLSVAGPTPAQKPPAPVPGAPVLNFALPLGVQRGQQLDLALTGSNLAGPTGVTLGIPAEAKIPTDDKNGQDNAKLKVSLKVPADTPLGLYPLRVATTRGISNPRLLAVDDLPQVTENGKNNSKEAAQPVPVPCVVAGQIAAEQADYFKVAVAAGQRLSFDVIGRRLGSPIDPQLSVYHAKTLKEIAYDNDSPGCQGDPRLGVTFKEAGEYVVEIKDVLNRGGADYVYRLRVGDFPLATAPVPMAAKRGTKAKVTFAGPAVEGVAPADVAVPADPAAQVVWVTPKGPSGLSGWPVALMVSDTDEVVEQEPNNEPAKATRVPVPAGVTGRFHVSDDTDVYVFGAKKGQKLVIDAQTLEWYTPTLVYLVVKNAKTNAEVAKSNPQAAPPGDQRVEFTAPDDGDYLVEVQHLNFAGGPSEVYHLTIAPAGPDFDLKLADDGYDLSPGSFAPIPVTVTRRVYNGPIEVSVVGHPGLTGTTKIKDGQANGVVVLNAKADVPLGAYPVAVQGKATIDGKPVVEVASARAAVSAQLAGLPFPPAHVNTQVAVAVKEKAPFALAVKMDPPEGVPGTKANVTVSATRDKGFAEEIALLPPTNLPPNVPAPKIPNIPKDKNDVTFPLDLNAKAPMGEFYVLFTGKTKLKDKEVATTALPLTLVLGPPFDLKVESAPATLDPGGKAKLKVVATRRGGYQGPIAVELRKLPAGVTAAKATIPEKQTAVEVDLTAEAKAAPGEKADVDAFGTATALNNLQNASPAFTVRVQKK